MADKRYEAIWDEAMSDLFKLFGPEKTLQKFKIITEKDKAFKMLSFLYIRYSTIISKLGHCYDQIINPQEREAMKKILEACIGRYLEHKHQLVDLEDSDFHYFDKYLVQRKMTPYDLEVEIPPFYRIDRRDEISSIYKTIDIGIAEYNEKLEKEANEEQEMRDADEIEKRVPEQEEESKDPPTWRTTIENLNPVEVKDSKTMKLSPIIKLPSVIPREEKAIIDAVILIQRHERCRVARIKAQMKKEAKRIAEDIAWLRYKPIPDDVLINVQERIRDYWLRYKGRRIQHYICTKRNLLFRLLYPQWIDESYKQEVENLEDDRRKEIRDAKKALEDAIVVTRIRIESRTDQFMEDTADELRFYIKNWYMLTQNTRIPSLPTWPTSDSIVPPFSVSGGPPDSEKFVNRVVPPVVNTIAGLILEPLVGSEMITAGHWIPVEAYTDIAERMEAMKGKKQKNKQPPPAPTSRKNALDKKKQQEEKEEQKKRLEDRKARGFVPTPSKFYSEVTSAHSDYSKLWAQRYFSRRPDLSTFEADEARKVHREVRIIVDEIMRQELILLNAALEIDKKNAEKKKTKKKKVDKEAMPPEEKEVKKRPPPPPPPPKKKKKVKTLDPRDREIYIKELGAKGILVKYDEQFVRDMMGEVSVSASSERNQFLDPPPLWGDFRQVVKDYCILPLGSKIVHRGAPVIKSVLLCGPEMLTDAYINAICTESGAVLFRLNPFTFAQAYRNKKRLIKLLTALSRDIQPSVIHIPNAEKIYAKSIPPEEKDLRLKDLNRIIKKVTRAINAEAQVLIVGTSSNPTATKFPKLKKAFKKMLCFPPTDLKTLTTFWVKKLAKIHGVDKYYNSPATALVTQGYSLEMLSATLDDVMTGERVISLQYKPLDPMEIYFSDRFSQAAPEKNLWVWANGRLPMYKKRKKTLEISRQKYLKELMSEQAEKAENPDTKKKKKNFNEIPAPLLFENISRCANRENPTCSAWQPKSKSPIKPNKWKRDLRRNQHSLLIYPISKPSI